MTFDEQITKLTPQSQSFLRDVIDLMSVSDAHHAQPVRLRLLGRYSGGAAIDLLRTWTAPKEPKS